MTRSSTVFLVTGLTVTVTVAPSTVALRRPLRASSTVMSPSSLTASRLAPKDASVGVSWPSPYVGAVYHPGGPKYVPALRLGRAREFDYLFLQGCRPGDDLPASLRSIWPGATDEEVRWVDERAVLVRESPCGRFRLYRLDHGGE